MIVVLIAAYNEESSIRRVLRAVPERIGTHKVGVVVVSDGSTDRTADVAREGGAWVRESAVNRGKGAALKLGLDAVRGAPFDALAMLDADGQHDPADLPRLVIPVLDGQTDLVIGSRYLDCPARSDAPFNRFAVRSTTVKILDMMLDRTIFDPYSGYRVLSRRATSCIELRGDRYESELEMLFCAARNGWSITEMPIETSYGPNTSKMGARRGRALGRIEVVARYAATIAREAPRTLNQRNAADRRALAS